MSKFIMCIQIFIEIKIIIDFIIYYLIMQMHCFNNTGLDLMHIIQAAIIIFQEPGDINQILNSSALRLALPNLKKKLRIYIGDLSIVSYSNQLF